MRVSLGSELSPAFPQITFQTRLQLREFPQLAAHGDDFVAQQVAHMGTGLSVVAPENQKLANLGERKTQLLGLGDEIEVAHRTFVEEAKAAFTPKHSRQQAPPLVKADCMNAEARSPRHFADLPSSRHHRSLPVFSS